MSNPVNQFTIEGKVSNISHKIYGPRQVVKFVVENRQEHPALDNEFISVFVPVQVWADLDYSNKTQEGLAMMRARLLQEGDNVFLWGPFRVNKNNGKIYFKISARYIERRNS